MGNSSNTISCHLPDPLLDRFNDLVARVDMRPSAVARCLLKHALTGEIDAKTERVLRATGQLRGAGSATAMQRIELLESRVAELADVVAEFAKGEEDARDA